MTLLCTYLSKCYKPVGEILCVILRLIQLCLLSVLGMGARTLSTSEKCFVTELYPHTDNTDISSSLITWELRLKDDMTDRPI